jgi:antitoxin (DNA-binding transcriptional repressor) of toxin-antitoxin stability system
VTAQPFSLTAPGDIVLRPDSAGTFKVTNSGTQGLMVHESMARLTPDSLHYPAASHATATAMGQPWVALYPANFALAAGQSETVHVSDMVPAGTQGDHYLNAVFAARPASGGHGNLHLVGAVGSTLRINQPGHAVAVTSAGLPVAPAVPHTSPAGSYAAMAGAVLLALAVIVALLWELRRRRARHVGLNQLCDVSTAEPGPAVNADHYGRWPAA